MKTERLGTVIHLSKGSGNLIANAETDVKPGEEVFNNKREKIGIVLDVFGPVTKPYVSIKPKAASPETLVNELLFIRKK
ncbi:H/ACA RNA-protein complex protein Gar1 [Candidatus Bathyarchaeota archaeon]|nr:H/ACA RNA-protein complex protein Gar1 [Candidatus Bathyarchaeota archaeon]MBS7631077.1 H/ACA RNA-protein complex protein Gar1 [Candidatus Bathyarchaeota archaeon]